MNKLPFPELKSFISDYNEVVEKAQSKAIFVRGIELQKVQVKQMELLLERIYKQKELAQKESNNEKSNLILCLELCADAVKNELTMVISLKEDRPDLAWQALIDAQREISLAIRNHPFDGGYLNNYAYKLYSYEKMLFPAMYFASRGCVVSKSKCSICNGYIEDCEHIKGYAYMGNICQEIIEKIISINEISLVENPDDKSCRIISFNDNGKNVDVFTHRIISGESDS